MVTLGGKRLKIKGIICAVLVALCLIFTSQSFAEQPIQVIIDGEKINFTNNPIIENGTTLVEFRPIFEKLGLQIGWNEATQTVTGHKDGLDIQLQIGSNTATVNGQNKQLSIAPRIINGKTMIPLRFIGEASGKRVDWDAVSKTVKINSRIVNSNKQNDSLTILKDIRSVIKINSDIYILGGEFIYIDTNNNYYISLADMNCLISAYYNDYRVESLGNPFIKGYLIPNNPEKYLTFKNKYLNINESYYEGSFSNNKGKTYPFSTKSGEEKGVILHNSRIIAPLKDVFDTLGIKYTVTRDDKNKMFIFSF